MTVDAAEVIKLNSSWSSHLGPLVEERDFPQRRKRNLLVDMKKRDKKSGSDGRTYQCGPNKGTEGNKAHPNQAHLKSYRKE